MDLDPLVKSKIIQYEDKFDHTYEKKTCDYTNYSTSCIHDLEIITDATVDAKKLY